METVKYQELANKSASELYDLLNSTRKELVGSRIKHRLNQLPSPKDLMKSRKLIAKIMLRLSQIKKSA